MPVRPNLLKREVRLGHPRLVLSADVSWRSEPGINRAYVWLSDGRGVGYRDLDMGLDFPSGPEHAGLLSASVEEWLATYGVPCRRLDVVEPLPASETGVGLGAWWRRRRRLKQEASLERGQREWRLDHPLWRVPTDPPRGDWRDLVRNEPGQALWDHLATLFELKARQERNAWRHAAQGEESLAAELWRIARPGQWRYLHSVPVGSRGSDIDHVLIGPGDVFTLNTKNHRGSNIWVSGNTFMVNGTRQRYLPNSRHEALRAGRLLSQACGFPVAVRGVIAVIDPRNFTIKEHPADVAVTTRVQLPRWLARQPQALDPIRVDAIFRIARRSCTWSA
jgi:hypothetical protein